ncbi:DNA replication complex GINS protein PSF2 [Camelus bactrianus]|uniref:DNA replication complex GINS protein PSF2 n=4 Tax=Camelus TaxID=9836 RepID=A0AC58P5U8_CAMBA
MHLLLAPNPPPTPQVDSWCWREGAQGRERDAQSGSTCRRARPRRQVRGPQLGCAGTRERARPIHERAGSARSLFQACQSAGSQQPRSPPSATPRRALRSYRPAEAPSGRGRGGPHVVAGKRWPRSVFPDAEGPEAAASPVPAAGAAMDSAEVEFLAEKELVTIIPNFSLDKIYLIGGDLGPFNPGLPVEVPLWLAINLKQRQKCRLVPPEWMDVEKLEMMRDHERKEETFTPMPSPYYVELTKLLLNHASDNIPKADEIRTLIKDVWDTRIAKLRVSADRFVRQQESHAKLDNLTLMEINTSGAFLTQVLNHMYKLRTNLQPPGGAQSQDF